MNKVDMEIILSKNLTWAEKLNALFGSNQVEAAVKRRIGNNPRHYKKAQKCLEGGIETACYVATVDEYGECEWKDELIESKLDEMLTKLAVRWGIDFYSGLSNQNN